MRRNSPYCFTPYRVRYLDNSQRSGYKFELKLAGAIDSLDGAARQQFILP